jgi:hypothetical protein
LPPFSLKRHAAIADAAMPLAAAAAAADAPLSAADAMVLFSISPLFSPPVYTYAFSFICFLSLLLPPLTFDAAAAFATLFTLCH